MIRTTLFAAAATLAAMPAVADGLPAPLQAALAATTDGPIYAYEMIYDDGEVRATGEIDATRPEGERVSVSSPAKDTWSDDFRESIAEMDAEADGDIWCQDIGEHVPETVELVEETAERATYVFRPRPEADADGTDKKFFRNLVGEITVDKTDPAILAFSMRAPKPFKPAFVAKIEAFELAITCARAPDGRTYVETMSTMIRGSAMGQKFDEGHVQEITRVFPASAG